MYILIYMEIFQKFNKHLCMTDAQNCSHWFANAIEYNKCGSLEKSLQELNKIKQLLELLLNTNDNLLGYLYNEIGIVLSKQKKIDESMTFYKKAIKIISINNGFECRQNTIIYNNIAKLYLIYYNYTRDIFYYNKSMKYYSNLIRLMKKVYGYNSIIVKKFLIKTGHILEKYHHYSDALLCYKNAIKIVENTLGFYHSEIY